MDLRCSAWDSDQLFSARPTESSSCTGANSICSSECFGCGTRNIDQCITAQGDLEACGAIPDLSSRPRKRGSRESITAATIDFAAGHRD